MFDETIINLFARACSLDDAGDSAAARDTYISVLARDETHAASLARLGRLLVALGYCSAARTVLQQAVRAHPADAAALVRLAHLLREMGDKEAAALCYHDALACDPQCRPAHQGLAYLLDGQEGGKAALHRALGFAGEALSTIAFRGAGRPVRVLRLLSAEGGNIPTSGILDRTIFESHSLVLEFFDPSCELPAHDVVFNEVGDADRCNAALHAAGGVVARTRAPVINPPCRVARTRRAEATALLDGIGGLRLPRVLAVPRAMVGRAAAELGLPCLLRSPGFHTGQHFCRVENVAELAAKVAALPGADLLALEYLPAQGADGFFRKYRVMFIGGQILPLHLAISADWKVHYYTADMGTRPAHRAEEARFLVNMPAVLGPRAMAALDSVQCALGLDYAGADFALAPDGRVILFEANAAMVIAPAREGAIWDYRRPVIAAATAKARTMLLEAAGCRHTADPLV